MERQIEEPLTDELKQLITILELFGVSQNEVIKDFSSEPIRKSGKIYREIPPKNGT
jgi:hypothetical protein